MLNYPVAEGKSGQQTVDMLQARIEQLGALSAGNFSVDCDTYQSTQSKEFIAYYESCSVLV